MGKNTPRRLTMKHWHNFENMRDTVDYAYLVTGLRELSVNTVFALEALDTFQKLSDSFNDDLAVTDRRLTLAHHFRPRDSKMVEFIVYPDTNYKEEPVRYFALLLTESPFSHTAKFVGIQYTDGFLKQSKNIFTERG